MSQHFTSVARGLNMDSFVESKEDFIEKGKKAQIGEIREWKGQKFQKQSNGGWIPVKQGTKGSKPSAFVNKTVQLIKEKRKNWGGWDENKEKIAESVLTKNEALAKNFMSMTFPAASVSAFHPSEKSIVISGADEIIFSAYKTIDTTSRNPEDRGSTHYNYNIYHKLGNTRTKLSTASCSSASHWTTPSKEKDNCKIEALMRYFHI